MTGTLLAQLVTIATAPILTRIYSPEDFGVYAFFFSVITILGSVSCGKYELAIMLPSREESAINVVVLSFFISMMLSLCLMSIILCFNQPINDLLEAYLASDINYIVYFVPVCVFFIGLFNALNYFNNRKKNYKDIKSATIYKSLVMSISQIVIGVTKGGAIGLIWGEVLSRIFANGRLAYNLFKSQPFSQISKVKMLALAKRYKRFPIYNMPSSLLNVVTSNSAFLLMPAIFGVATGGAFSFAQKLVALPSSLISKSVSQVLYQKMVESKNNKTRVLPLFIQTVRKLIMIALPTSVIIHLFGFYLFDFVFGEAWFLSGQVVQYLAFVFFITFVVSPVSIVMLAFEELEKLSLWQCLYFFSTVLLFLFFYFSSYSFQTFLLFFVIHEYIMYLLYFFLILYVIKENDRLVR